MLSYVRYCVPKGLIKIVLKKLHWNDWPSVSGGVVKAPLKHTELKRWTVMERRLKRKDSSRGSPVTKAMRRSKKGESFGLDGTKSLAGDWNEGVKVLASSWYLTSFFSPALSAAHSI